MDQLHCTPTVGHLSAIHHFLISAKSSAIAFLHNINIDRSEIVSVAEAQLFLNLFLTECHEGVGGIEVDSVGIVGIGGFVGVGRFSGEIIYDIFRTRSQEGILVKRVESKRQHGGKVWRFEGAGRNGGIGVDSSENNLGLEDIAVNGLGGVVELEERIMSGDCGTEDRRIVVLEDCRIGGKLNFDDKSHMLLF